MIASITQNCAVYKCAKPAAVRYLCDDCYQILVVEAHHRAAEMNRERIARKERISCYRWAALGILLLCIGVGIVVKEMGGPRAFLKEVRAEVRERFQ